MGTDSLSNVHLKPGEGRSLRVLGESVTCKVTGEQTGGAYSLFEVESPIGGGTPAHVQHREDEAFYVLKGEYEFLYEDLVIKAGAGSLVYVPRGNLHAYKNVGKEPGRMLVSQTPGGLHERFLEELGEAVEDGDTPPSPEGPLELGRIAAVAVKYGIEIPSLPEGELHGDAGQRHAQTALPHQDLAGIYLVEEDRLGKVGPLKGREDQG